jgi:hypothetical protein
VLARDQRVDDAQLSERTDTQRCDAHARSHVTVACGSVFEGAHDGRADRDDSTAVRGCGVDERRRRRGMWYGSSSGSSASRSASPVEEMPPRA